MKKSVFITLLALTLAQVAPAFASDLEKTLKNQYEKQVLGLRNPLEHTHQEFDSTGKPLGQDSHGRWTIYGGIFVQKVSLGPDRLRLEGPWVGIGSDRGDGKPSIIRLEKEIKVEIHLDHPAASADDLRAVLDRVFFLDDKDFEHAMPEFRRSDFVPRNDTTYKVSKKDDNTNTVMAPVPTHTPEPGFSQRARNNYFQGVVLLSLVIDKAGTISRIRITRALGMGLDQEAVDTVKTWRFQPATRNGQPVTVEMNVEISFNLY